MMGEGTSTGTPPGFVDDELVEDDARFAPADPLDNRALRDWKTRWDPTAWELIAREARILVGFFFGSLLAVCVVWCLPLTGRVTAHSLAYIQFAKYGLAFAGGMFGGTLLDIKWLYHTVAKGSWNQDRVLWRLMTPLLSAGTAFMFMALLSSGVLVVIDRDAMAIRSVALAVGMIVGYFSDSAVAKVYELAVTIFGVAERHDS